MRNEFGSWLRNEIKKSGKTQAEFSDLIGVEQPQLSRILNGTRGTTNQVLDRIAVVLGVSPESVFRMAGELRTTSTDPFTEEAKLLFSQLPPDRREEAIRYIRYLALQQKGDIVGPVSKRVGKPRPSQT